MEQISNDKILIVTVLYNQRLTDTNVYKSLLVNFPYVYIQDNSSDSKDRVRNEQLPENWVYVAAPENPGLSKAYNSAARYAREKSINWIIIADQDTVFPVDYIDKVREAILEDREKLLVPVVKLENGLVLSPAKRMGYFPKMSRTIPSGRLKLRDYAIINSGMAVKTELFEETGGYNEKVFLDMSDVQFLERVANLYPHAKVISACCLQNFSAASDKGDKQIARFSLFCRSVRNYESTRKGGGTMIGGVVLKRMLNLVISTRRLKPVRIYIQEYLRGKR